MNQHHARQDYGLTKRKTSHSLVVNDFGVKCLSLHDLNHLIAALRDEHTITIDQSGSLHIGVTLKWNYRLKEVNCSMPSYYPSILKKFQHLTPTTPQHSPHPAPNITRGKSVQCAKTDSTPKLDVYGI